MKTSISMIVIFLALTLFAQPVTGDVIYDPTAEFSDTQNPNGVWSFGFSNDTTRNGNYTQFTETAPLGGGPGGGSTVWHADMTGTAQRPFAGVNTTDSGLSLWEVGELGIHPGQSDGQTGDGLVVMSFLAPSAGFLNIDMDLGVGFSDTFGMDWYVERNDSSDTWASGSLFSSSPTATVLISDRFLSEGDSVNLVIDSRNGVARDLVRVTNAKYTFSAVPEPSTAIATSVLLGVALMRRKRLGR